MIAFLAITSVINIALGYALAVYLGRAAARRAGTTETSASTLTLPTRKLATQEAPASPTLAATPAAPVVEAPTVAPPRPQAISAIAAEAVEARPEPLRAPSIADSLQEALDKVPPAPASDDELTGREFQSSPTEEEPPVEQELLAGIEEFRTQLAQLKGASSADPAVAPRPSAATTA